LALLWSLWGKFANPAPPEPFLLTATGAGALIVNVFCAFLLVQGGFSADLLNQILFCTETYKMIPNPELCTD